MLFVGLLGHCIDLLSIKVVFNENAGEDRLISNQSNCTFVYSAYMYNQIWILAEINMSTAFQIVLNLPNQLDPTMYSI